jgi:hypothetical protein
MTDEQEIQLISTVYAIKQEVTDLRKSLLGNGQPGAIQILHTAIEKKADQYDFKEVLARVDDLETSRTWAKGVSATLASLWFAMLAIFGIYVEWHRG